MYIRKHRPWGTMISFGLLLGVSIVLFGCRASTEPDSSSAAQQEQSEAASKPIKQAGRLTMSTCGMVTSNPFIFEMLTNATTAAEIGEAIIPIWLAILATAQGRSGRIPFLSEMSQIIGMSV